MSMRITSNSTATVMWSAGVGIIKNKHLYSKLVCESTVLYALFQVLNMVVLWIKVRKNRTLEHSTTTFLIQGV